MSADDEELSSSTNKSVNIEERLKSLQEAPNHTVKMQWI